MIQQAPKAKNIINARPIFAQRSNQNNDLLVKELRGLREDNKKLHKKLDDQTALAKENQQSNQIKIKQNSERQQLLSDRNKQSERNNKTQLRAQTIAEIKQNAA